MGGPSWKPSRPPFRPEARSGGYRRAEESRTQEPRRWGPLTLEEKRAVWVAIWGSRMARATQVGG